MPILVPFVMGVVAGTIVTWSVGKFKSSRKKRSEAATEAATDTAASKST